MARDRYPDCNREKRHGPPANSETSRWTAVVVIVVAFETAAAAKFITAPRLSRDDVTVAEYYATELWTDTLSPNWWQTPAPETIPEMNWYRKINLASEPRYEAMALLLITRPVETPIKDSDLVNLSFRDTARCTAFYIAPDTLMTVAHCLADKGISKESGHIIIARQNYDAKRDKQYTKEMAKLYERIVVEWIHEATYCKTTPAWSCEEASDYAFLKIKGTSHNNAHYTLVTPKSSGADKYDFIGTHANVVIAGYPGERSKFKEPAEVEGVLHYTTDEEFKKQPRIAQLIKASPKQTDSKILSNNQIAAITGKGVMAEGGSGGPWLISEKALTKEQKTARLKWVIGISLWGTGIPTAKEMPDKSFAERQKFATVMVSKLFTKEFVAMANDIAAVKNGAKTMQSVMEEHVK